MKLKAKFGWLNFEMRTFTNLGNAVDLIAKNLAVSLGTTLSKTFATLATSGHFDERNPNLKVTAVQLSSSIHEMTVLNEV